MKEFSLAELNERHQIIKEIKKHLSQSTEQDVIEINTREKLKKIAGETTKNVIFHLAGGQIVEFLFRKNGDIIKVRINKRDQPTAGHLIFDEKSIFQQAIFELGEKITKNQRAFELRKARVDKKNADDVGSTATHKDGKDATTQNKAKQIADLSERVETLDRLIEQKQGQIEILKREYEQLAKKQ